MLVTLAAAAVPWCRSTRLTIIVRDNFDNTLYYAAHFLQKWAVLHDWLRPARGVSGPLGRLGALALSIPLGGKPLGNEPLDTRLRIKTNVLATSHLCIHASVFLSFPGAWSQLTYNHYKTCSWWWVMLYSAACLGSSLESREAKMLSWGAVPLDISSAIHFR